MKKECDPIETCLRGCFEGVIVKYIAGHIDTHKCPCSCHLDQQQEPCSCLCDGCIAKKLDDFVLKSIEQAPKEEIGELDVVAGREILGKWFLNEAGMNQMRDKINELVRTLNKRSK